MSTFIILLKGEQKMKTYSCFRKGGFIIDNKYKEGEMY